MIPTTDVLALDKLTGFGAALESGIGTDQIAIDRGVGIFQSPTGRICNMLRKSVCYGEQDIRSHAVRAMIAKFKDTHLSSVSPCLWSSIYAIV